MIKTIAQSLIVGFITWLVFRAWFAFRDGATPQQAVQDSVETAIASTAAVTNLVADPARFEQAKAAVTEFSPNVTLKNYFTPEFAGKFFEVAQQVYHIALQDKEVKNVPNAG